MLKIADNKIADVGELKNTFDRWVGAVGPIDRRCCYQPMASPSKRLCPCRLSAQIRTIL